MNHPNSSTSLLQHWLERLQAGDPAAREQVIRHSCERLERLTRHMLRSFPGVKRWDQTDDVFQNVMLRLLRALETVPVHSARHFLSLAALQMRRELVDLVRHYSGPWGQGAHHHSDGRESGGNVPLYERPDSTLDPARLAAWSELHRQIAALPDEERELCDLLWYQGLTQPEAAGLLNIPERTLKRRWQAVRLKLQETCGDGLR